ncbi:hypothetical protein E2C01_014249 [Portunus trituberculatus]|uniref:Uncharacterized protein n=1 Tax=Portunus trituberculatus TaxID=210409 RepID=A0A5B7DIP1_PORTR|nr:hypothetical protein [Portunus trituberculatus]
MKRLRSQPSGVRDALAGSSWLTLGQTTMRQVVIMTLKLAYATTSNDQFIDCVESCSSAHAG